MHDTFQPRLPRLHLEQLALGELPAAARAAALARLAGAAERELAALRAGDAEVLAAYPPAAVAAEVRRRAAGRRIAARSPRRYGLPAVAAAAVVVIVAWPEGQVQGPRGAPEPAADPGDTRVKGLRPYLVLHRQVGDGVEPLRAPTRAVAEDVLQVSYVAAGAAHGVIASLDGRGVVTLHFPAGEADSTALRQAGPVRLAQAFELDDAPGFERFVFVTAAEPLAPARVLAALRALAGAPDAATRPLPAPASWQQHSFLVTKVPR